MQTSIYPSGPCGEERRRKPQKKRLMRPSVTMRGSHFLLVLLCYDRRWGFIHTNAPHQIIPLPALAVLTLKTDSASDMQLRWASACFSEPYIWVWEVSRGWVSQRSSQQLVPEDRGEVVGHDLLLLLGAMVFQWQDHGVGRHLSRDNHTTHTQTKKSRFNPHFQQLAST